MPVSVPRDVKSILESNEVVEMYIQQRIYHPKFNIDSVVITNERLILRHPHWPKLKTYHISFFYRDFAKVSLEKGDSQSAIECVFRSGEPPLFLRKLPSSDAERAYNLIKDHISKSEPPPSTAHKHSYIDQL